MKRALSALVWILLPRVEHSNLRALVFQDKEETPDAWGKESEVLSDLALPVGVSWSSQLTS